MEQRWRKRRRSRIDDRQGRLSYYFKQAFVSGEGWQTAECRLDSRAAAVAAVRAGQRRFMYKLVVGERI
jgi:hypothetical protein